jgi:hypothetical protein
VAVSGDRQIVCNCRNVTPLRVRSQLARVHVFDHTLAQRGDSLGCHSQLLSWVRLMTPASSRQGASPATDHLPLGDSAQDEPHLATIAKRFSALVESRCGAVAVGRTYLFSASFVWRCLSGSAVTPFPHPARRTRTCGSPASGSRTRLHAFAHGSSRPSAVRRTSPKYP